MSHFATRAGQVLAIVFSLCGLSRGQATPVGKFPTISPEHEHARALLANAMRYLDPAHNLVDPVSGYPVEGWNQDPSRGLFLRSFTQLTAIGQYMEVLASVAAGHAEADRLPRDEALRRLGHLVDTLDRDQVDPMLAAQGLLGNFLDVATGKRLGPLASTVDKAKVLDIVGAARGEALWKALQAAGWIAPRNKDAEAEIHRVARYGYEYFDGPLAPFAAPDVKQKVMDLLDRRVVMIIFGDNSNLTASAAKTIGALLAPGLKENAEAGRIRKVLERFLERQAPGYHHLYDAGSGLFYFGWDATKDRLFGWEDLKGKWTTGHMDYLVNEFRGPATFVAVRYGISKEAIANLGFQMKAYAIGKEEPVYVLAPWEGSAFQAFGLSLSLGERDQSSWGPLLRNVARVEVDFADRHALPGFLSESYTGVDVQYTGSVGIPAITVSPRPRITDAASLYTVGVAYGVAPDLVEPFLARNWGLISTLFTDHGPWEGYNTARKRPIEFQTTAHTLALILGLIGRGSENMDHYLRSRNQRQALDAFFPVASAPIDFIAEPNTVFAWTPNAGEKIEGGRQGRRFEARSAGVREFGVACVSPADRHFDLSGGTLVFRYSATADVGPSLIQLKPKVKPAPGVDRIPQQIEVNLTATEPRGREVRVPLPATPGLETVGEVVLTHGPDAEGKSVDLSIHELMFRPAR